jgi:hypothetical protein
MLHNITKLTKKNKALFACEPSYGEDILYTPIEAIKLGIRHYHINDILRHKDRWLEGKDLEPIFPKGVEVTTLYTATTRSLTMFNMLYRLDSLTALIDEIYNTDSIKHVAFTWDNELRYSKQVVVTAEGMPELSLVFSVAYDAKGEARSASVCIDLDTAKHLVRAVLIEEFTSRRLTAQAEELKQGDDL